MNDAILFLLWAAAGVALGCLFFGGLWWSTRMVGRSSGSTAMVIVSFLGRTAICVVALFLLLRLGGIAALLTSMGSFMITQMGFVSHFSRKDSPND